jgi:hypothetical protein
VGSAGQVCLVVVYHYRGRAHRLAVFVGRVVGNRGLPLPVRYTVYPWIATVIQG